MAFILIVLVMLVSLVGYQYLHKYSRSGRMIDQIPGPMSLPLFGNLLQLMTPVDQFWGLTNNLLTTYYPNVRLWLYTTPVIFMTNPDDTRILLSCKKNINKSDVGYEKLRMYGSDGLIFSGDDKWRNRHKLVRPAFNIYRMKVLHEIIDRHAKQFVEYISSLKNDVIPNLSKVFTKLSFDTIVEYVLGVDVREFEREGEDQNYIEAYEEFHEIGFYLSLRPHIPYWILPFLGIGRRRAQAAKTINGLTERIVRERQEYHRQNGFNLLYNEGSSSELSILDLLIKAKQDGLIDDAGIIEEINIMLIAGFETTAGTLTFLLMLLAENQDIQEKARAEVLKATTDDIISVKSENYSKLKYLNCCMKETLRLFPVAAIFGRKITHEIQLATCTLPVDSQVIIPLMLHHRDSKYFPDANKFHPGRFFSKDPKDCPTSFIPFSLGARSCIGQKVGPTQVIAVMANILQNFRFETFLPTENLEFHPLFVLKPKHAVQARFTRIK